MVITSSSYLVIWSSGHLVIWSSSQCGYLVICSICHMSSGHLVIVSSGHLVILSSGLLVIWSFPILWNPVLFLWNTWIIIAHSESCFGDIIEQSGYLVCCIFLRWIFLHCIFLHCILCALRSTSTSIINSLQKDFSWRKEKTNSMEKAGGHWF